MSKDDPFHVPWLLHHVGGWVHRCRRLFVGMGRLETKVLAGELAAVRVTKPIYVCGLARSGSTLLHLTLAARPGVATHRARDYPLFYTPYWSRRAMQNSRPSPPRERAHGDRVLITSDSPEALEEMLWMAFFPTCHDPAASCLLTAADSHPAFESFYRAHVAKLLLAERAARYVAKANYHVARLPYLLKLFPDARFVIPVRDPVGHVGSLARQHERFSEAQRRHPRALAHLQRAGHFEFGLDRRPMNLGDADRVRQVERAWSAGEEARGWGRYWALVHDHLADLLDADAAVRAASVVVRYESMCESPAATMEGVFRHCDLPASRESLEAFASGVSRPDYYQNPLTTEEVEAVRQEAASAARRWGYAS